MMPISIRPTMTQKADASMPTASADSGSAATAGNQFSLAPITLATDEADPFERLRRDRGVDVAREGVRRRIRSDR